MKNARHLRVLACVASTLFVAAYVALDHYVIEALLPRDWAHATLLAIGIAGLGALAFVIFGRVERLTHDMEATSATLRALNESGLTLSAELSSEAVLQTIVDQARKLGHARYAALALFDDSGRVSQFWTSGITPEQRAQLGPLPTGHGLLGTLMREQRPIRLRDVRDHPASSPLPHGHPTMRSFLGVPVVWHRRSLGNLYVTEKVRSTEFTADDEAALQMLAAQAAVAFENVRLHQQEGRTAALEERHRIGMDLHDGAMQTLYGVGLMVQNALKDLPAHPERVGEGLGRAIDRLNTAIADLRIYALDLRPIRGSDRPLSEALPEVARQVATNALLRLELNIDRRCEASLDKDAREAIFYIAADAMTNVARHARAGEMALRLRKEGNKVVLEVADDGVGFDAERAVTGLGLRNMRERAFQVGALFGVITSVGGGTRVRLELPMAETERA